MENTKNWELFLVYENILANLEKSKNTDSIMAKFFIDIEKQIEDFEEAYPKIVAEYHFKHRP